MKHLLSVASASALMAGAAFAGNIEPAPIEPVIAPAPMPVYASPTWAGSYVGANLTWGQADVDAKDGLPPPHDKYGIDKTLSELDGFGGGLRAGYDWQLDKILLGVGGEYNFGKIDGGWKSSAITSAPVNYGPLDAEISNVATIFARIGYDAGEWLPYALAGYTWADGKLSYLNNIGIQKNYSTNMDGMTVGLGVERRLTESWAVYGEWTYTDFGKVGSIHPGIEVEVDMNQFKLGVNYQF